MPVAEPPGLAAKADASSGAATAKGDRLPVGALYRVAVVYRADVVDAAFAARPLVFIGAISAELDPAQAQGGALLALAGPQDAILPAANFPLPAPVPLPHPAPLSKRGASNAAAQAAASATLAAAQPEKPAPAAFGADGLRTLVAKHAAEHGVPFEIAHAMVMVESRYNPRATGRGGYVGLTQISPATARSLGYSGPTSALYEPDTNLRYGIKYLAGAYRLSGGDLCKTVSRYQGGHRVPGVTRAGLIYCAKMKAHIAALPKHAAEKTMTAQAAARAIQAVPAGHAVQPSAAPAFPRLSFGPSRTP